MAGTKSRWKKGNQRYDKPTEKHILDTYREADGWRNGARVRKPDGGR